MPGSPAHSLLRLFWSPGSLGAVAFQAPLIPAALLGGAAAGVEVGVFFAVIYGGASEPYADLTAYFGEIGRVLLWTGAVLSGITISVSLALALLLGRTTQSKAEVKLFLLSPVPLFLPIMIYAGCVALDVARSPGFDLYGPGGKPAWIESPLIAVLGSCWWLPTLLMTWLGILAFGIKRIELRLNDPDEPICARCGYDLRGSVAAGSTACPECGQPAPAGVAPRRVTP